MGDTFKTELGISRWANTLVAGFVAVAAAAAVAAGPRSQYCPSLYHLP